MTKMLNRKEVEAALKHVAEDGLRSDPFVRSVRTATDLAMRLRNEIRIATLNWATVEAFNKQFEDFREPLIEVSAWQPPLFAVRAVVRDVLMTLMRMTENPDRETFCQFLNVFHDKTVDDISAATSASVEDIETGLTFLREYVPLRWGKDLPAPDNPELFNIRARLEPVRNSLIAHAKIYSSLDLRSDIPKAREFLLLVSKLSDAACMICNVPRDNLQERWDGAISEATAFWKIVASGGRNQQTTSASPTKLATTATEPRS